MQSAEGTFLRQTGGKGYAARGAVEIEAGAATNEIRLVLTGFGSSRQGDIEDASAEGYADWAAGAKTGRAYALRVAERSDCSVTIRGISGLSTDTDPTIVAAAAADAVWKALNYVPSETVRQGVERVTLRSWNAEPGRDPGFGE